MNKIKRKDDIFSEEKRKSSIESIIRFFREERNEEIGILAAEKILDLFVQIIGEDIYNKGVEDSKILLKKRFEDLEFDLDILLKK